MNRTYLSIGSNLGDRESNLREAVDRINQSDCVVSSVSSIYETTPWGFTSGDKFLNIIVAVDTEKSAPGLLEVLLQTELSMGRKREGSGYSSRGIDLDIIFFNNLIINSKQLTVPHPRAHKRLFVLIPMSELAPQYLHPVLQKRVADLVKECEDEEEVALYKPFLL